MLGDSIEAKKKQDFYVSRPHKEVMYKGLNYKQEAVVNIDAGSRKIETKEGNQYGYDYLVVCPGLKLRYDKI